MQVAEEQENAPTPSACQEGGGSGRKRPPPVSEPQPSGGPKRCRPAASVSPAAHAVGNSSGGPADSAAASQRQQQPGEGDVALAPVAGPAAAHADTTAGSPYAKAVPASSDGAGQPASGAMDGLPSWCDRPLITRQHYSEDAQVEAFCYLPGHPLLALAAEGKAALLRKVLEQGADVDAKDSRGFTALHLACWHACVASVHVLLEGGAGLAIEDAAGRTASELALAAGHADVDAMLQRHRQVREVLQEQQQWQQHRQPEASLPGPEDCS